MMHPTPKPPAALSLLRRGGALVALALASLPAACASDGANLDELDALDVAQEEIRGGSATLEYGVVQLNVKNGSKTFACTGAIINNYYIVTAAHCLVDTGVVKSGSGEFEGVVYYFDPDTGKRRITLDSGYETLRGHVYSTYNSKKELDPESDFALVQRIYTVPTSSRLGRPPAPWRGVSNKQDYLWLSLGNCDQHDRSVLFGQGFAGFSGEGSGTLRSMAINLKECHKHYFFDLAGSRQTCMGDSGGPYIVSWGSSRAIAGLHSGSENTNPLFGGTSTQNNCTSGGKRQWGTRMNDTKLRWIESITGSKCEQKTVDGHRVAQCW